MTYPLYLIHQVAGYAVMATLKPYVPDLLNFSLVFSLMIALAYSINRFLEEPLQRLFKAAMPVPEQPLPALAATVP